MKFDLSTVGIGCVACGTRTTLKQAIQNDWQQCLRCNFFIDPHCHQIIQNTMGGICPSFSQGVSKHLFQPTDIPSDQILIFVKDQYQKGRVGALINTLFYKQSSVLVQPKHKNQFHPSSKESPTREEIWRRYGLVLVKRSQGKWKTWEKVGKC